MAKYTVISQRPTVAIDKTGIPQPAVEITFEWGDSFIGSVMIDQRTATKDSIKQKIEAHIATFDLSNE